MSQIDVSKLTGYARVGGEGVVVTKLNAYLRLRVDSEGNFSPDYQSFCYAQKFDRP